MSYHYQSLIPPSIHSQFCQLHINYDNQSKYIERKVKILRIVSKFSLLRILLDGSEWFFSGNLHLCTGFFWYFNNEIKNSITQVQWNVMPW